MCYLYTVYIYIHTHMFAVMDRLRLVDPSVRKVRLVPVSREKLVLDLGYLLAAIPSSSFPPHPSSLRFQPAAGLCLASLTPECLAAFCEDFLRVGSLARQLELFCQFNHFVIIFVKLDLRSYSEIRLFPPVHEMAASQFPILNNHVSKFCTLSPIVIRTCSC